MTRSHPCSPSLAFLVTLGLVAVTGGSACYVQDDGADAEPFYDLDEKPVVPRSSVEGFDCSLFQNYPDPPDWEGPGDHCDHDPGENPGCPAGLGETCEVPDSGWEGPYNIFGDNCHDAASCGVDAGVCAEITTGILSCTGNTQGIGGHTVNYSVFPGTGQYEGDHIVCLSEPQHPDPDASKCCWVQDDDTPDTGTGQPGHACYEHRCGSQAQDDGGTSLPSGQCWPTPSSEPPCGTTWNSQALACCQQYASRWDHALDEWCSETGYDTQIQFRCEAYAACVESAGGTLPEPPQETGSGGEESGSTGGDDLGTTGDDGSGSTGGTTYGGTTGGGTTGGGTSYGGTTYGGTTYGGTSYGSTSYGSTSYGSTSHGSTSYGGTSY